MTTPELVAIITATGAILGALGGYLVKAMEVKRTTQTQDELAAIEGYDKLTHALQARLEIVEQKLYQAEKRIGELECENAILREQVSTLKTCIQT